MLERGLHIDHPPSIDGSTATLPTWRSDVVPIFSQGFMRGAAAAAHDFFASQYRS